MTEKNCSASAAHAAYAYTKEQTGCEKSAATAYQHAVAKAAYDECLGKTGCEKTAKAEYEKANMAAAEDLEKVESEKTESDS